MYKEDLTKVQEDQRAADASVQELKEACGGAVGIRRGISAGTRGTNIDDQDLADVSGRRGAASQQDGVGTDGMSLVLIIRFYRVEEFVAQIGSACVLTTEDETKVGSASFLPQTLLSRGFTIHESKNGKVAWTRLIEPTRNLSFVQNLQTAITE